MEKKVREELPSFKGQYSDEKILFNIKENIINFIFKKLYILISLIIFGAIVSAIIYYFSNFTLFIISIIIFIILIFIYYYIIYSKTNFIFTTRRIIKDVRSGIFSQHRKELKIMDIKSSLTNRKGFLELILRVGNIKIEGTETKSSIYFTGVKEYSQVSNYIGRVIDYIKLKGHTDNIARYQDNNYRKENKSK